MTSIIWRGTITMLGNMQAVAALRACLLRRQRRAHVADARHQRALLLVALLPRHLLHHVQRGGLNVPAVGGGGSGRRLAFKWPLVAGIGCLTLTAEYTCVGSGRPQAG